MTKPAATEPDKIIHAKLATLLNISNSPNKVFTDLQTVRLKDAKLKYRARIFGGIFLAFILLFQNIFVFTMVWIAYRGSRLPELTTLFAVLIPATLAESAAIVHTAVKWIFKETDYKRHS